MPDLMPGFTRHYNHNLRHRQGNAYPEVQSHIQEGVLRHYHADQYFHQHPAFHQLVRQLLENWLALGVSREKYRLSFLAHIGVELALDVELLKADPSLAGDFYAHIQQVDEEIVQGYFLASGMLTAAPDFFRRFRIFSEVQYLHRLQTYAGAVEGLCRISERVTRTSVEAGDAEKLQQGMQQISGNVRYSSQQLLAI